MTHRLGLCQLLSRKSWRAGKIVRLQSNESKAENRAQCQGSTPSCIYNVMAELDPEALGARNLQRKKKKVKGHFISEGPLRVVSLDDHDKLCG